MSTRHAALSQVDSRSRLIRQTPEEASAQAEEGMQTFDEFIEMGTE